MPRWDGSLEAVDTFVTDVSTRGGQIDPASYARLYLIYADLEGGDYNVVQEIGANATVLRSGMRKLLQQYPKSDYILNSVARFACIDSDFPFYKSLQPQLTGHASESAWPDKLTIASCNKSALWLR